MVSIIRDLLREIIAALPPRKAFEMRGFGTPRERNGAGGVVACSSDVLGTQKLIKAPEEQKAELPNPLLGSLGGEWSCWEVWDGDTGAARGWWGWGDTGEFGGSLPRAMLLHTGEHRGSAGTRITCFLRPQKPDCSSGGREKGLMASSRAPGRAGEEQGAVAPLGDHDMTEPEHPCRHNRPESCCAAR